MVFLSEMTPNPMVYCLPLRDGDKTRTCIFFYEWCNQNPMVNCLPLRCLSLSDGNKPRVCISPFEKWQQNTKVYCFCLINCDKSWKCIVCLWDLNVHSHPLRYIDKPRRYITSPFGDDDKMWMPSPFKRWRKNLKVFYLPFRVDDKCILSAFEKWR